MHTAKLFYAPCKGAKGNKWQQERARSIQKQRSVARLSRGKGIGHEMKMEGNDEASQKWKGNDRE